MPTVSYCDTFLTLSQRGVYSPWSSEFYFRRLIRIEVTVDEGLREFTVYFHKETEANTLGPAYYEVFHELIGTEILQLIERNNTAPWREGVSYSSFNAFLQKLPLQAIRACNG